MIYSSVPILTIERDLEICLYETSVTIILLPSLNDYINHNNAIDRIQSVYHTVNFDDFF